MSCGFIYSRRGRFDDFFESHDFEKYLCGLYNELTILHVFAI